LRTYEAVFILDDRKFEDAGEAFSREIGSHIKSLGGKGKERNSLGRKQFARPIGKHVTGLYWGFVFDLDPSKVGTFQDKYRLNTSVLRLTVLQYEAPPRRSRSEAAG
jgi:ribosomal protein S6